MLEIGKGKENSRHFKLLSPSNSETTSEPENGRIHLDGAGFSLTLRHGGGTARSPGNGKGPASQKASVHISSYEELRAEAIKNGGVYVERSPNADWSGGTDIRSLEPMNKEDILERLELDLEIVDKELGVEVAAANQSMLEMMYSARNEDGAVIKSAQIPEIAFSHSVCRSETIRAGRGEHVVVEAYHWVGVRLLVFPRPERQLPPALP